MKEDKLKNVKTCSNTGTFNKNGPQYFSYTIKTNQANSLKFAGDVTDL